MAYLDVLSQVGKMTGSILKKFFNSDGQKAAAVIPSDPYVFDVIDFDEESSTDNKITYAGTEVDSYECNVYRSGADLDTLKHMLKIRNIGINRLSDCLFDINYRSITSYLVNEFRTCDWIQTGKRVRLYSKDQVVIHYSQDGVLRICIYVVVPSVHDDSGRLYHLRINYVNWENVKGVISA